MEAIRIHRVIKDDRIEEVKQFIGKKVEIIILPEDNQEEKANVTDNPFSAFRSSCPNIIDGMEFQNKMREEWEK